MPEALAKIHGEPSYRLHTREVELFLSKRGGHLAPVRFRIDRRWVAPYSLPPWRSTDFGMVQQVLNGKGDEIIVSNKRGTSVRVPVKWRFVLHGW